MNIEEIKQLIQVLNDTGIAELEVRRGDTSVRIRRNAMPVNQELMMPTVVPVPIAPAAATYVASPSSVPVLPSPAPVQAAVTSPAAPAEESRDAVVKSPIVGTYYDAPSPGAAPFVKVGDKVHSKQVLCIIESMKLMNEIEAEVSGTLTAKLVENGRPVEYGESLFTIRPS